MKYPDNSYICNRMTSLQSRHTGFWLHLAAWSVVFGLPLFVPGGREPVMNMQEYVRFLVVPLSFMAVFYVNYLLLIDRYLSRGMWGDSCSLMRCSWPESCYSYTFSSASEYRRAPTIRRWSVRGRIRCSSSCAMPCSTCW